MMSPIPTEFPSDREGKPLAWPDLNEPGCYVDAWNGIYDSREAALAESQDWVRHEDGRTLAYGEPAKFDSEEELEHLGRAGSA